MSIVYSLFFVFLSVFLFLVNQILDFHFTVFFILFSLLVNLYLIYLNKSNQPIFVLLIFAITYPIYIFIAYVMGIPYHLYMYYQTDELTSAVFLIQSLSLLLMFGFSIRTNMNSWRSYLQIRNDSLIFYISVIILLLMIPLSVFGKSSVISTGSYSIESGSSILFEYCLIFLILGYLYSGELFNRKLIILFLACVFMILPLLFGRRLPFLMIVMFVFNIFFVNKLSLKQLVVIIISIFSLLSLIALIRIGISTNGDFFSILLNVSDENVMSNNQGGVIVSCAAYIGLIKDGFFDLSFRLLSLLGIITSPFTIGSFNIPETYINTSALQFTAIPGNGGLPGVYFYIWGGWIGVLIFSIVFNRIFYTIGKNRYFSIYALFLLITFPRWYAYNMLIVVKMGFWLLFIVFIFDAFHNYRKKI